VSSFVWTPHWATNGSTLKFHLGVFTSSYPFQYVFNKISKVHRVQVLSCFGPKVGVWLTIRLIFPTFWLSSSIFFYSSSNMIWITPSLNCKYPLVHVHTCHWSYGHSLVTLHSWQWTQRNSWCSLWHLCWHRVRCWLPRGTKIITCTSFNHIQFFSLMNQHCVHQKWHLHLSWRCHCQPNVSKFISSILHNSRIHSFQCGSSQRKELFQSTPH
jgi:hypothetical protein